MNSLPFISILVMSHNQEDFIGECIDSVLSQQYDGDLEFIFCDDCSSDSTFEIIQKKVSDYSGGRRIVAHRAEINGRVATNMNIAINLAKGDWFMRVDGDDILHPDRVRLSAKAIMEHPHASAISGQLTPFEGKLNKTTNPEDDRIVYKTFSINQFTDTSEPIGLEWWGGVMTMHRRIFEFFGNMPSECHVLDDTMFATRALMLGDFVIIQNAVLLYYRRHNQNTSSSRSTPDNLPALIRHDREVRDYYRRSIPGHEPILKEIESYLTHHPEIQPFYNYFNHRFNEMKRQAFFWNKSWKERIADAHISGPFWKKIPWAIRVMCPFTYALAAKLLKKS